jgi:hypothetical protein
MLMEKEFAKIKHTDDPTFIEPHESANISERTLKYINKPELLLPLHGQTSMTFVHSCCSQKHFMPSVPAIPTTQTTICKPFLAKLQQESKPFSQGFGYPTGRGLHSTKFFNLY